MTPYLPVVVWVVVSSIGFLAGVLVLIDSLISLQYARRRKQIRELAGALEDGVILEALRRLGSGLLKTVIMALWVVLGFVTMLIPPSRYRAGPHTKALLLYGPIVIGGLVAGTTLLAFDLIRDFLFSKLTLAVAAKAQAEIRGLRGEDDEVVPPS